MRDEQMPGRAEAEMRALMREAAAKLVVRVPRRKMAVTLLAAGERDGMIRWRGTDNAQILTRRGMIFATRGLGDDLMSVEAEEIRALILAAAPGQATRIHRRLDGEDRIEIQSWICDVRPEGRERLRVSAHAHLETLRITETCHGPRGGFRNSYWLRQGRILQTRQFAGVGLGPIELLFLP